MLTVGRRARRTLLVGAVLASGIAIGAGSPGAETTLTCFGEPATIVGTEGDDTLNGTSGDDVVVGLGGNDLIRAAEGNDMVCGGEGNDMIQGSNGGGWIDVLSGDGGDDYIDGGSAFGGIVVYEEAPGPVTVDLVAGTATGWGNDRLIRIRGVLGSRASDTITGDAGPDLIAPLTGDDVVRAGGGADIVLGDPGNDHLDGGGSAGDTLDFSANGRAVNVDLGRGTATGADTDTITGFERVTGTRFADRIRGNAVANELVGGAGNDRLYGGSGRDRLIGQKGRDYADGGPARDLCSAEQKRRCP